MHVHTLYIVHTMKRALPIQNKGMIKRKKLQKYKRFKRFLIKSYQSISLPVKNMASGAARGHITTAIFSTDKVDNLMIRRKCYPGMKSKNVYQGVNCDDMIANE